MVEHLIGCRQAFGDLEEMLVMEVITQKSLRRRLEEAHDAQADDAVTASQISERTGIPRQTVRRKLFSLERRGWVARSDDAAWRLMMRKGEAAAVADLASLDRRGLGQLVKLIDALEPYVNGLKSLAPMERGRIPKKLHGSTGDDK